jgi:hydrogenase/urease accessory protein HupE
MNHFTPGLLHPWMTPAHFILLLALGLWLGQHVPLRLGLPLKVFAPLSAAALAFTTTGWIAGVPPPLLVAIALLSGAVVALEARLPSSAGAGLLAAAAMAIGLDSGAEAGTPLAIIGTLLGTWVSLSLGLVNIAYYVSLAAERRQKWMSIGLRIAGSWIVAISLLMLAFSLRR